MSLIGDGIHNFIDGAVIAASFIVDVRLGLASTFAIALHEVPQEIGDFSILLYGGFSKKKALLFNFITALTAVFGGILAYLFMLNFDFSFLLPLAAGGFVYIALSDLIPEIKEKVSAQMILFLLGVIIMFALSII